MSAGDSFSDTITVRVTAETVLLIDGDPTQAPIRQEGFLERLRHRHNLGLDDAHAQLHAFEMKNPELLFENS